MKKILLIEERAYGDGVIVLSSIAKICNNKDFVVDILCNEECKNIFTKSNKIRQIWVQNFWTSKNKSWNIIKQWQIICKLRRQHYDYVVDVFGDVRERTIGYLCGGEHLITINYRQLPKFNGLYGVYHDFVLSTLVSLGDVVYWNEDVPNIYLRYEKILNDLGVEFQHREICNSKVISIIGLHPFASQQCKEWSFENWRTLTDRLLEQGKTIIVFGAPNERKILEEQFGVYGKRIELFTGSLREFMDKLRELDLMIGLDSFSIHAAYAAGVRNIMINGANDCRMWQTPLTTVVSAHDGSCKNWPCYNKPRCSGKFSCINSITVDDVMEKVGEVQKIL